VPQLSGVDAFAPLERLPGQGAADVIRGDGADLAAAQAEDHDRRAVRAAHHTGLPVGATTDRHRPAAATTTSSTAQPVADRAERCSEHPSARRPRAAPTASTTPWTRAATAARPSGTRKGCRYVHTRGLTSRATAPTADTTTNAVPVRQRAGGTSTSARRERTPAAPAGRERSCCTADG